MKAITRLRSFLVFYLPTVLVQILSSRVTFQSLTPWYQNLEKASWNPPAWVFGPAWTLLYIMMAAAISLVSLSGSTKKQKNIAYALFFGQLALNCLWSFLFFGQHWIGWALVDLTALAVVVFVTTLVFFRLHAIAGALMIPYLLWLLYALSLNAALWVKNG